MKSLYLVFLSVLFLVNCEDVVDVNLKQTEPKLVIDASINWFKGRTGSVQRIKLSLSSPFFSNVSPPASGATVFITDSKNIYDFTEDSDSGTYTTNSFIPNFNESYTLNIEYNNEQYVASNERFIPVAKIDSITQNKFQSFTGTLLEITAHYTDPKNIDSDGDGIKEENFYYIEKLRGDKSRFDLEVSSDQLYDGNTGSSITITDNFSPNEVFTIRNYGITERFYEFMSLLIQQVPHGGPFEIQPATLKGNCINTTNRDNFPFGYFRLSEVDQVLYTLK